MIPFSNQFQNIELYPDFDGRLWENSISVKQHQQMSNGLVFKLVKYKKYEITGEKSYKVNKF